MTITRNIQLTKSISFNASECELIDKVFSQDSTKRAHTKKGGFWHTYRNKEQFTHLEVSRNELELIHNSLQKFIKVTEILFQLKKGEEKEDIQAEGMKASFLFLQLETFLNGREMIDSLVFVLKNQKEINENPTYQYLV